MKSTLAHVVVVGGGFGGLRAVMSLSRAPVQITLIDRRNFHLFQPLLYQVAGGLLAAENIASPLRQLLRRQKNVSCLVGSVVAVDASEKSVTLGSGASIDYDYLILSAGSTHNFFGNESFAEFARGLKSAEDANAIRSRILETLEQAETETFHGGRPDPVQVVVVGAGPTGVELACDLAEMLRDSLSGEFRSLAPDFAEVILLEAMDRVLPANPVELSEKAGRSLDEHGVRLRLSTRVVGMGPDRVTVEHDGYEEEIKASAILWTAGVKASSLAAGLAASTGAETDRSGRLIVEPDLSLPGYPEISVIGDMACVHDEDGRPLPAVATAAIQEGRYVAWKIKRLLSGRDCSRPFRFFSMGSMTTLGSRDAVADLRLVRLSGYLAWIIWAFVHLFSITLHEHKILVLVQWLWLLITGTRSAKVIYLDEKRK